jgi:hypothetical protein
MMIFGLADEPRIPLIPAVCPQAEMNRPAMIAIPPHTRMLFITPSIL